LSRGDSNEAQHREDRDDESDDHLEDTVVSQLQKDQAELFLRMHHGPDILVLANSWDVGSSRLLESCGYKAVATTSMGIAASLGHPDAGVMRLSELLPVVSGIVRAVNVPVTADMEAGYGDTTDDVVSSVKAMIDTGIVGINIEDSVSLSPVLTDELEFSERIAAIRELSDAQGLHLVINARTDAFYTSSGSTNEKLTESIRRGNRYAEAGADCVFVQPVWEREIISTLVKEIDAPINILANPGIGGGTPPSVSELQELGVARLSLGSGLMKATLALLKKVADELSGEGTYQTLQAAMTPLSEAAKAYEMAVGPDR
jgi:2-methylisocitrate lyase-like PEP mutase family enzyme